jgi:hypothetical protein
LEQIDSAAEKEMLKIGDDYFATDREETFTSMQTKS